jgi:hypothetical protein
MSNDKKPATRARVTGLHKINAAAKQLNLDRQLTGAAAILVTWRRPTTIGVVVRCCACGRLHQHTVALDATEPVMRASRCGLVTYQLPLDDVLGVSA